MQIATVKDLCNAMRQGKYTSVGSYPTFYLTADGGVLSYESVCANLWQIARAVRDGKGAYNDQWRIVACDVNWEDPALFCDDSGKRIESAYAESDASE